MLLFSSILFFLVAVLLMPVAIRYLIQKQADYFNFKWNNFNSFSDIMGIFDFTSEPLFQKIAFQISSLRFSYRNKKIKIKISQCKLYLDLKPNRLSQVDGYRNTKIQKSKILRNMQLILNQIRDEYQEIYKLAKKKAMNRESQFQRSKKGVLNFILMVLFQVVELQVDKLSISLIESRGQQPLEEFKQETSPIELNKIFKLFCTNRKYRFIFPDASMTPVINKDEKLEIQIKAKAFNAEFKNEFTKKLDQVLTIDQPSLNFHMPFGFTFDDCMNESKVYISAKEVSCFITPSTCTSYKYLKYFRVFQARLYKFITNELVIKDRKPTRSAMPKLIELSIPQVSLKFTKLEDEITCSNRCFEGNKCSEVNINLSGVMLSLITKLHDYSVVTETMNVTFEEMKAIAAFQYHEDIQLCHFFQGGYESSRHLEVKTWKILKTFESFKQENTEMHIHPVIFQLYEAYININLRPYLEFDFDLYKTWLEKYIDECHKKSVQAPPENKNASSASSISQNSNQAGNQNSSMKEVKMVDILAQIDDKILLETILNTKNVSEKVSLPYFELDFKSKFVEMYSYCGENKISLTSSNPRYFAIQKEESSEYQGVHKYTFTNLLLQKIPRLQDAQTEKIFTMESYSQDSHESNDIIVGTS